MKKLLYTLSIVLATSFQAFGQNAPLTPEHNPADNSLTQTETYQMGWFMLNDTLKIKIGTVHTEIQKEKENTYIITTVDMQRAPTKWVDSTIVATENFSPIYHSSYNQQRDMVLDFSDKVTGYYLDKQSGKKTKISENVDKSFFDSNFYPQLIRWLPLKKGYAQVISIFDYNPKAEIGVLTATIKNTEETTLDLNGSKKQVWKVTVTDDISKNTAISTYYIERQSRKLLRQEIDLGGRKMFMELMD